MLKKQGIRHTLVLRPRKSVFPKMRVYFGQRVRNAIVLGLHDDFPIMSIIHLFDGHNHFIVNNYPIPL